MLKSIQVSCSSISYTGDSIGDDIRVEIEVGGKFWFIDKKIKAEKIVEINQEIIQLETDKNKFEAEIKIKVIEKDLVFNDVGQVSKKLIVDLTSASQRNIYKIEVKELRQTVRKSMALFEIILETSVSSPIRYASDLTKNVKYYGWLQVALDNKKVVSLPAYLKVRIEKIQLKREYFTILEGVYRDKKASIKLDDDGSSFFLTGSPHTPAVHLVYSISDKTLQWGNKNYPTVDYAREVWIKGVYDIEIPDAPHVGGHYYAQAKRAVTWFRVGHSGEKYIHTGRASLGCITLTEQDKWDELCQILLKARKGDGMSVGTLEVVD